MNDVNKKLEQLRKLLAKAQSLEQTGSEDEAAVFMAKVHSLLAELNMTMDDLNQHDEDVIGELLNDEYYSDPWRKAIWTECASAYFCMVFWSKRTITGRRSGKPREISVMHMVGRQHNAVVAAEMSKYLINTVVRLATEAAREAKGDNKWKYSFMKGCAARLVERLRQMKLEALRTQTPEGGDRSVPALVNAYESESRAIQLYMEQNHPDAQQKPVNFDPSEQDAFDRGAEAGKDISLNTQLSGNKGPNNLIEGQQNDHA